MFCKVHCFGLGAWSSLFCTDPLIISWYVMRCSFEAMGNAAEFFKEESGHTTDDMGCKHGSLKYVHRDSSCWNFHIAYHCVSL